MSGLLDKWLARGSQVRLFEPPDWRWAKTGDVGWWVRAGWEERLLDPKGLRLDEWRQEGRVRVVKTGPQRVVYRVDLPGGSVFVKHFLVPSWREMVRQWIRRGKGRNEGARTRYLEGIGVPTITPIALGEQRKRRFLLENYLITPEITGSVPLNEFVEQRLVAFAEPRRTRIRQALADALAVMTARLHHAGFVHQDFHPGNILVRLEDDDHPVLAMIDLDALRVCRRLTWPIAKRNLALLNHYFWLRSNRTDRQRFFVHYLRARQVAPDDPRSLAREIEQSTRAWAEKLWRHWGKRCARSNKYFKLRRARHSWAISTRDLDAAEVKSLLIDADAPFRRPETVIIKDSRTTLVAETRMKVGGQPVTVIYKRFNRKKWLDPFLTWFRPSRAWQAWQAGQHLLSRAVPTPRNLAIIVRLRPFWNDPLFWYLAHETYLVTIKAEPSITLQDYVNKILPGLDPADRRIQIRRLTLALAKLLRTLHERSLSDRDLKTSNILIVGGRDADQTELSVIDLVGVRLIHPLPKHRRIQNLARLHVSLADVVGRTRTDSLFFLRAYLPWGLSPHNDWKSLWRSVEAASFQKIVRNHRRGRRVS